MIGQGKIFYSGQKWDSIGLQEQKYEFLYFEGLNHHHDLNKGRK